MCLITTKSIPEIAQEDIVCYKFYILIMEGDINYDKNGLLSPYQGSLAPTINKVTNTLLDRAYLSKYTAVYMVGRGFHSFKYLDDLIEESYKKREIIKLTVNQAPQIKADEGCVEDCRD